MGTYLFHILGRSYLRVVLFEFLFKGLALSFSLCISTLIFGALMLFAGHSLDDSMHTIYASVESIFVIQFTHNYKLLAIFVPFVSVVFGRFYTLVCWVFFRHTFLKELISSFLDSLDEKLYIVMIHCLACIAIYFHVLVWHPLEAIDLITIAYIGIYSILVSACIMLVMQDLIVSTIFVKFGLSGAGVGLGVTAWMVLDYRIGLLWFVCLILSNYNIYLLRDTPASAFGVNVGMFAKILVVIFVFLIVSAADVNYVAEKVNHTLRDMYVLPRDSVRMNTLVLTAGYATASMVEFLSLALYHMLNAIWPRR